MQYCNLNGPDTLKILYLNYSNKLEANSLLVWYTAKHQSSE